VIRALVLLVALVSMACATHLAPAPGAQLAGPRGNAATASVADITVTVRPDDWRGSPSNLWSVATPMLVTIDNRSGRALRVRYDQFALRDAGGKRFAVRSPYDVEGYVSERVEASPYTAFGPPVSDLYWRDPFWRARRFGWTGAGWYDPVWEPWPSYRTVRLPTSDMVRMALPESVVPDQSRAEGFVFFERAPTKRKTQVDFVMDLIDARTGERVGAVTIPFVVE